MCPITIAIYNTERYLPSQENRHSPKGIIRMCIAHDDSSLHMTYLRHEILPCVLHIRRLWRVPPVHLSVRHDCIAKGVAPASIAVIEYWEVLRQRLLRQRVQRRQLLRLPSELHRTRRKIRRARGDGGHVREGGVVERRWQLRLLLELGLWMRLLVGVRRESAQIFQDNRVGLTVEVLLDGERHNRIRRDRREVSQHGRDRFFLLRHETSAAAKDGEFVVVVCRRRRLGQRALSRGRGVAELRETGVGLFSQVKHDGLRHRSPNR